MRTVYKILVPATLLYLLAFDILPIPNISFSFVCKDPKLSHPYNGETISEKTLLISAFLGSFIIIGLVEVLKENSFNKASIASAWILYKKCFTVSACVLVLTEFLKSVIKEPRPHFLHSCKPDTNEACQTGVSISVYNCTNQLSRFRRSDLVRSFPSGHTSLSVFMALYCAYLIHVRIPPHSKKTLLKTFLTIMCLIWGLICSLSRISDRRHHWWDVLGGAVLGLCSGIYAYFYQRNEIHSFLGTTPFHVR